MTKAARKRDDIVERLTDFLLHHGLDAASLRPMAAAAGTSDRMLLYYFKDKDAIVDAALTCAAARLADRLSLLSDATPKSPDVLECDLLALTADSEFRPFMCLYIDVAARAARGDMRYRAIGFQVALGFQHWIAERLDIGNDAERMVVALRLLRLIDGAMLLRSVGLPADEVEARQSTA